MWHVLYIECSRRLASHFLPLKICREGSLLNVCLFFLFTSICAFFQQVKRKILFTFTLFIALGLLFFPSRSSFFPLFSSLYSFRPLCKWLCLRVFGQVDLVMWILTGSIMLYLRQPNLVFCVLSETTGEPRNISSLLLYLQLFLQCAVLLRSF